MPDDTNQDETVEHGQVDDPSAELENSPELPTDPDELKAALIESQRSVKKLSDTNERLKETVEEERTGKVLWHQKWEEEKSAKAKELEKPAEKQPASKFKPTDDIGTLITSGELTMGDLEEHFRQKFVTPSDAEQIATQASERTAENLIRENKEASGIVGEYPDLANQNSPLMKATVEEMQRVQGEKPNLDRTTAFELAARRAADRIGYKKLTNGNGNSATSERERDRERLRNAQPGAGLSPGSSKGVIAITDADRRMARQMNGGVEVSDAIIKESKQRLVQPRA